jgi:transcriptional regulator with XRE-family HTH domain
MAMNERIRILLVKRGNLSEAELARRMGISPQNLNNKMKRDNFSDKELRAVAQALGCSYKNAFIIEETGEEV